MAATEQILDSELETLLRLPAVKPSVADFTRDVNPVSGSVVGRGISKGILTIGETGSGFLESLSDILGAKGARDFWREKGDQLADLSRNIPVAVESISDIKSLPDAGAYAALAVGQLLPQIALSLGSGLAARAATKGASAIKQLAATVGGAALPSVIQEVGGISREIRETSGELRPEIAFPAGLLAGALDTLTPARFLGKVLDTAKDEVKERTWKSLVRQTFKEIPRTGAVEALTESAQESIAISANKFADSTYDLVNGQNFLRILDAGLQGMIGGGAIGAVTPAIQRAAQRSDKHKVEVVARETTTQPADLVTELAEEPQPIQELVQPITPPATITTATTPTAKPGFREGAMPALDSRLRELHNLLIDSDAFGKSEFYDGTFPIPRRGGIVSAKSSERYASDWNYANKVDAAIRDVTDTMVRANRQRMALMDKPGSGAFGVAYSVGKARATYGVNVIRAWHNEAKQKYPYTQRLGNISVRESFQNSLDAVMAALQARQINRGSIVISTDEFSNRGFRVEDNGVGMSDIDIGEKFLSLHSTGKAVEGRFGGFGIAKAVILGPDDSATWTLRTRDNSFNNEQAQANEVVGTVPFKQGTDIEVKTDKYIIDDDAKRYVESTELPKQIAVTYDGVAVVNPFKGKKAIQSTVAVNDQTSYTLSWYPKAPGGYEQKYLIRLVDAKTGAKLTQAIKDVGNEGFTGTIVVDITTTATPGSATYPLVDSRMELKWGAEKPVSELVAAKSVDVNTARRALVKARKHQVASRAEWADTLRKIQSDSGYQTLADTINAIWVKTGSFFGSTPNRPFTPLGELNIQIDTGFKGYHGGSLFQAKHLAAFEAVSRLMAHHAGASVTEFYGMLSKPIDGGQVNAEHAAGGVMGLNFINIDKTALTNPANYALFLRDLVAHELTHDFYIPHNEAFTSKEIEVQRLTAHLFPDILRIAEAVLGQEFEMGRKASKPVVKIVERLVEVPVERRVEVPVPVEVQTIVEKYLSPEQLQFIYDNVEQQTPGATKDDLYYPRQTIAQDLWAEPIRTGGSNTGLGGEAENTGIGGGPEQPGSPSVAISEPGGLGTGTVGTGPGIIPQAQPAPGLATEIPVDIQTPPTVANTVEELRAKLPQSGLATEHQTLISAFLDTKAVKYLDGMQFAIRDALENGWQGSYLGDLIEIARNSKPDTGPHEFMHRLYDVLPESDQAVIRQARLADIRSQVERGTNSFDLDALAEFERREVRSDEFVAKKFNREVYHLSSDAEYFAGTMSGRFQQKLSAPKDFVSRIREIVADLWAAIKKSFRLPQTSEQIFRNLMAGRYDVTPIERLTPQASVRPITRRKSLEQVVRTAAVYNPTSIPTEAVMATGQSLDFAQQIGNAIQTQVPPEFQRRVGGMLGFGLVDDISNYVAYVLGVVPQNYAQARATLAAHAGAEGLTNTLALHANRGLEIFETRVLKVKKALARQRDKVLKGPEFARKMRQWANASVRSQAAEAARKSLESSLRSGLAQAVERVREAGANEAIFEAADTERRFYEGLLDNSRTLTELVQDMASRIGTSPETLDPNTVAARFINSINQQTALSDEDADALVRDYIAALPFDQRPRVDRTTGRNERLAMIKVAADLLARNADLRTLQLAAIWSEQTQLRKPVRTIEDQLVRDMTAGKAPSQAIGPLITKLRNLATDEGRAAAVVAAKYKELLKEFNRLVELEQADMVATNVMESPAYRTFRTTVARDAGAEVRPTEAKDIDIGSPFFTQHVIYLPNGTRVELRMHQDAAGYAETERLSTQAANDLLTWLHDPANADSPYRGYYQRQYDTLKAIWHSSAFTNPPKQFVFFKDFHFKVFDTWLGLFDGLMRNIGTRATGLPRMASQMWKDSVHQFGNWTAFWKPKLVNVNVKAAKSHPDLWDDNSRGNAVNQWHAEVFTPIMALDDDLNTRLKAGDTVPGYGHIITAEDMEAVRVQLQGASGAMAINVAKGREKITTPTLIEDRFIPGVPFLRQVLKTGTRLIFRRIYNTDIAGNYAEEMDKLPEPQRAQAQQTFWDKQWNAVAAMIVDRSAEFATIVPFEPAIKAAQSEVTDGNIHNVQQLADFISANGSVTQADALAFILKEMDKHTRAVARYKKQHADLNAARIETIEAENPFTTNRGPRIAPFFWYSYGFKDSASIYNFAASGGSFYFETFLKSLKSLQNDLESVAADVGARIKSLSRQLGTGQDTRAAGQIRMANVKELELGKETQRYSDLAKHISGLEKYERDIRELYRPGGKAITDELTIVNRILGPFVAGILASEYTITRNAIEGGFLWNGIRLSKLYGSTLKAFPQAFMQLFFNTLKLGYNTVPAVARGVTKLHPFRAVATLANTGNILAAERDLFGDAVMEVANSLFGKNDLYRALEAAGLALPQYPKEQVGAMAELPWTGGEITAEAYSDVPMFAFLQKMGGGMLTFIDAQMTLFVRPLSPRIGDLLANMTISSSTLKGIQNLEAQARLTFAAYRDAGVPAATLRGRIFSPDQILGKWFGAERTQNEVREIEHWFNDSGVPLHTSLQEYFERLEAQGPSAEWLTPEEKMRIVVYAVELSNAATPLNRAPRLKKGTISRLLGLLLGWNTNQYRQVATVLSRSASDPNYSAYQLRLAIGMWFVAVLAFSALGQYGIEEVMRFLAKFVRGEERATRQPTEQEGERAVKAWITYAFNTIPLVSTAVNSAFSDMPNRAAFSPNFLVQAKLIDLGNYVSGAVNSRDPTYRLPQLLKGFIPGASVFLNRLPSTEGSINVMNVSRLYRRYGEPETLRTQRGASGGMGATATPLTPYGERIINAVARKDTAEAIRLKNEAIKVATDMGKPDPERSVEQMILNRLPERRAFQGTISEAQYGALLSKMTPGERQYVARTSANLGAGLTALGIGLPKLQAPRRGRRGQSRLFAGRRRGLRATRLGRQRRRRRLFA